AGRLDRDVHRHQQGRRARPAHPAGPRQRDAAAGTDRAGDDALRSAGRVPDVLSRVLRHRAPHDVGQGDRGAGAMTAVAAVGRLTAAYLTVALVALLGGVVTGLAQGLEHAGINVYPALAPVVQSY